VLQQNRALCGWPATLAKEQRHGTKRARCAQQQMIRQKCRYGSKATFPTHRADVRYYPESDRDSDMAGDGRYVPIASGLRTDARVVTHQPTFSQA
jgi:hypothetical protein